LIVTIKDIFISIDHYRNGTKALINIYYKKEIGEDMEIEEIYSEEVLEIISRIIQNYLESPINI